MEIIGVQVELPANTPVLLLKERDGSGRVLPIYIGGAEASAIHQALHGETPPRPLTHDLFCGVLSALGAELGKVIVTELRDGTFFSELHLVVGGAEQVVSARPSDAMALAVRLGTPVFASSDVLDEAGQVPVIASDGEEDSEALVDEFRRFIDEVTPDEFES